MTDDARKLLLIHFKYPNRGTYAMYDACLSAGAAEAAYDELLKGEYVEVSSGVARVGETTRQLYKLTDKGYAAAKESRK